MNIKMGYITQFLIKIRAFLLAGNTYKLYHIWIFYSEIAAYRSKFIPFLSMYTILLFQKRGCHLLNWYLTQFWNHQHGEHRHLSGVAYINKYVWMNRPGTAINVLRSPQFFLQ